MFPMDPHLYNSKTTSDLSVDKQNIVRQLGDMFNGIPLPKIREICEESLWNVDACIDKLVRTDGDNNNCPEQPTTMNVRSATFSRVAQNAGGAVPKVVPYVSVQPKPSVQALPAAYANIWENIKSGYKIVIIMRGAPGSGKSHLAKSIVNQLMPGKSVADFVLGADDYFYDSLGRYKYSVERLEDAHLYCHTRAREKAVLGWSPIIIDNTNMKMWEMLPYAQVAVQNGYIVELMEPLTPWRNSAGKLASKNDHNVPKHKIQRMLDQFEVGTANDLLKMLKETKYTVTLPQLRTYPPPPVPSPEPLLPATADAEARIEDENDFPQNNMQTKEDDKEQPICLAETNIAWPKYEAFAPFKDSPLHDPKSPRQARQSKQQQEPMEGEPAEHPAQTHLNFEQEAANFWGQPVNHANDGEVYDHNEASLKLFPSTPVVWQAYEQEATNFWGVPVMQPSNKVSNDQQITNEQTESCGLLQLLKEGVKSINVTNNDKSHVNEMEKTSMSFTRHRVGCANENEAFVGLRDIYCNVPTAELWDLFVKCNGSVDWAIDILLRDDDSRQYENTTGLIENNDRYDCGCDNPMKDLPTITSSPIVDPRSKPQRPKPARHRVPVPTAEGLEVKEAIERSFVLSDEHYSNHVNRIRNKRNGLEETTNQKSFVNSEVQTEGDENDTISEEGGDAPEDILEINLGEDLVGQLINIFKSETPALNIPEKYKTNVFMRKSLARELYFLWMESVYNQAEEQRQSILKEDEDFARLLKNPKYENCQQPPDNIRELLDMEYAWMIYKTEQQQLSEAATRHQQPNDLASHLTRMKLCEIFPNIPQETLLDILAAHNNNFSATVEVLKSSIEPAAIDEKVSTKDLIEKARIENEKLNNEVEKQQQDDSFLQNNVSRSSSYKQVHSISQPQQESTPRKRSLSPDEAKRLALKEFEETRNYAAHHCQLRAECYQKAKDAIQRGNSGVALYYSHIANLHKKKIDIYNHRAANCIMEVHDLTQNNPDFIDLHYLHVIEAIACLDIFVDKHIAKLRSIFRSFKYVFIITGRGLHSTGGVSTIKTRVKSRLKERNLKWSEVNPGLLKVKIFSASKYAKNL